MSKVFFFIIILIIYLYNYKLYKNLKILKSENGKNFSIYYISKKIYNDYNNENKSKWGKITVCLFVSIDYNSQGYISTVMNNYNNFWPNNIGKKIIVLDKGYNYLETYITNDWEVHYEEYNISGYMRRQYSTYIAYKYCIPNEYIAYMDSDSVFTMKIEKFMLFDNQSKPYFLYSNKIRFKQWNPFKLLKFNKTKWGDAMITFPVVIYTKHLIHLNIYLKYIHNSSLDKIVGKYFTSQFCVILEFLKFYYSNKYHFAVYEEEPILRCGIHIPYAYNLYNKNLKFKNKLYDMNVNINRITYDGICSIFIDIYPDKCCQYSIKDFYYSFYITDVNYYVKPKSKDDIKNYEESKMKIIYFYKYIMNK